MKNKKNKRAFTIVELVIVIAVIAILVAVLIPTFAKVVSNANISYDIQLIRNINTALAVDKASGNKHNTMQDALDAAKEGGYIVEIIAAKETDNKILWDSKNDLFCYLVKGSNTPTYYPESNLLKPYASDDQYNNDEVFDVDLWEVTKVIPTVIDNQKYSMYYVGNDEIENLSLKVGFDAGTGAKTKNINYVGNIINPKVVINTKSYQTTLEVEDEGQSSIYHYGVAGLLNIIKCHTTSYHENGIVGYVEISKGRLVFEQGSKVTQIHINANNNAFDEVIIADNGLASLPVVITRDEVSISIPIRLVLLETTNEIVYVYPAGGTGTTAKTEDQNINISSDLGLRILDTSEVTKYRDDDQKQYDKENAIEDGVIEELIKEAEERGESYAARINKNFYTTLQDGKSALRNGETLVLLKDLTLTEEFDIYSGSCVLDLNGHSLKYEPEIYPNYISAFNVSSNAKLYLINNSENKASFIHTKTFDVSENYFATIQPNGTMEIDGIEIINNLSFSSSICNWGTLKIKNCVFKVDKDPSINNITSVYTYKNSNTTIENTTFYAAKLSASIRANGGNTIINNCDFILQGEYSTALSTSKWQNVDLSVEIKGNSKIISNEHKFVEALQIQGGNVTLSGNVYIDAKGGTSIIIRSNAEYPSKVKIEGGKYYGRISLECSNEETEIEINYANVTMDKVAKIGNKYYNNLEWAIKSSTNGDEIILLEDETINNRIDIYNKNFSLNLNGHNITYNEDDCIFYLYNQSNITILDDTDKKGKFNAYRYYFIIVSEGCTLAIKDNVIGTDHILNDGRIVN